MTAQAPGAPQGPLRVLILARSAILRRALLGALGTSADVCVVGAFSAEDAAIERARREAIDAVLVEPPSADGDLGAVGRWASTLSESPPWFTVSEESPTPAMTTTAILQGASGVLHVKGGRDAADLGRDLKAQLDVRRGGARRRAAALEPEPFAALPTTPGAQGRLVTPVMARRELLAIGCSTGGPPAVAKLIAALPESFTTPIALVQHMAAAHMQFFVEGLARQLSRPVLAATEGMLLEPHQVCVAPGDVHMLIERHGTRLRVRLSDTPAEHNCRPAVDPFFRSVAATCKSGAIAVVLTGMGSDGALGGKAMRDVGAPVLVQDAQSSVVWGMPGATYQVGAACAVLPLEQLPGEILQWTLPTPT